MRSMSLLQMAGGVAVAGVVAAGSTAFTAAGLTKTLNPANERNGYIGGSVSHTVTGATLTGMLFTQAAGASPGENKVTGITLTFDSATPDGAVVTVTQTGGTVGGAASGGAATGFFCQPVQADNTSACTVGHTTTNNNGDWFTGITSVVVGVV